MVHEQAKKQARKVIETNEGSQIKDIDFFKTSFWGEPIPVRKIDRVLMAKYDKKESAFASPEKQSSLERAEKKSLNLKNSFYCHSHSWMKRARYETE
jgi:hypothetical protein